MIKINFILNIISYFNYLSYFKRNIYLFKFFFNEISNFLLFFIIYYTFYFLRIKFLITNKN